jgi:trehalose/maltose hydrolase-like predicted phosphorylase
MENLWTITETVFDPSTARAYEGLFTLGSGYLHVRGSLEEHLLDAPQNLDYTRRPANVTSEKFLEAKAKWGTYVPGVRGSHPLLNRGLVNLPFFLDLTPVAGEEKLDMEASQVDRYVRSLDQKTATLRRTLTWRTRTGNVVEVVFERFVSAAHPHLCLQQMQLTPEQDLPITLWAGIDSDVRTSGFDMFVHSELAALEKDGLTCSVVTNTGDAARLATRLVLPGVNWQVVSSLRTARLKAEVLIPAGTRLIVEKRTAVTTSFDQPFTDPEEHLAKVEKFSYDEIRWQHAAIWQQRWEKSDVIIEGDEQSQLALRCSIFHLLRAHPDDPRLAIDPKGYAGDAYRGCYFWDTEMYLLPFFLYTDMQRARSLVEYRIHSLPGAKANAIHTGYVGARYAWEADIDGTETCPNWQYRDHEVHVTADVVYAMVHYARAAQEIRFLTGPAAGVILETARYWLDRLDWRKGENHPSLLGVMGPDEYTPISSNNAYTNRLASFNLALAAELGKEIGVSDLERAQFAKAAAGLPILRGADGVLVLQCEEFMRLAEPAFERFWLDRSKAYATQVSQEWLYRSKCLKQADVLMLMLLFSDEFSEPEILRAWDYYLPYTTHDSSLSAGAHAILACRLGKKEEAWKFWQKSSLNDLDFEHGGAAEGVHIAGAGVNWQMAIFGFAGLTPVMNSSTFHLRPQLPNRWTRLAFPVIWQNNPLFVDLYDDRVMIHNRGMQELTVKVFDQSRQLLPGEHALFEIEKQEKG